MAETDVSLEIAIRWQLTSNHYPPVPTSMVPVCIAAIEVANQDGSWDDELELPDGILYKGRTTAPAWAIIEQHHLQPWIDSGDEY